jgi:tRNA wybutosine-synthesizing protein 2
MTEGAPDPDDGSGADADPDAGPLAAVVEKPRAQAAIGSLRAEGVYDDSRSTFEAGDGAVGIPVTAPPTETEVLEVIREAGEPRLRDLADHLRERGWSEAEIERAPGSWAVVGTVVLVDVGDAPRPEEVGEALLALHGGADTVLARGGIDGAHREPSVEVLAGEGDTRTVHREHGTEYALDLAEVMFSPGNKAERARMGEVVAPEERVLDPFAGIGYFAVPMARAGARVTAVERNPVAFEYLLENAVRNGATDRIEAYRGDCREVLPALDGRFDRAVLGYYDAHEYLDAVLPTLADGGTVHMHEATPEALVPDRPVGRLREAAAALGRAVEVLDVREVKGYSEGVAHVVVDARIE